MCVSVCVCVCVCVCGGGGSLFCQVFSEFISQSRVLQRHDLIQATLLVRGHSNKETAHEESAIIEPGSSLDVLRDTT